LSFLARRFVLFETLTGSHAMQGLQVDLPTFVGIIAVAAFLAGLCGERLRAKLARWGNIVPDR
jgi:hypothetical protein